ncbi:MAG: DUF6516 family protein [Bacteroidota bacterium]
MDSFRFLDDNEFVRQVEILDYFTTDSSRYFKLIIYFIDGSELHASEYSSEIERNYSFHWQKENELLCRWDNAPHHKNLKSFPYHLHLPSGVEDSLAVTLDNVLDFIESEMEK